MPYEFKCRNCGKIISVTILEPGEQAYCQKCHTINIVPNKNTENNDVPVGALPGNPDLHNPIGENISEKKGIIPKFSGEIISEIFKIYFSIVWKALVLYGIALLPNIAVMFFLFKHIGGLTAGDAAEGLGTVGLIWTYSFTMFYGAIAVPLANGAVFYIIASEYAGEERGIMQAAIMAMRKALWLIAANFMEGIILIVLFFIPILGHILLIYISVIWSLKTGAIMLEDKGILESIKRSENLVNKFWWNIFGIQFLIGFIFFSPFIIALFKNTAVGFLILFIYWPVFQITNSVIYFNQRAIKEGYNNDQLKAELANLETDVYAGNGYF